ncbi:sulfurtransferase complex subunit TusB [Marinospirillum perlucidum]|uniref:sulfurtransferase complex subunit TusB n=1 Tax=Marinospirillum perlucidum TaxID=1982602 RepID=UPI000DF308F5|nr:sulfurtransferase complex subunit TusB [Marinospirillum perlucidum]
MATLHQLNTSDKAQLCLPLLRPGDNLLLMEAAVSLLTQDHWLKELPESIELLALEADVAARGLSRFLGDEITLLKDSDWVAKTLEVKSVCSW